MSEAETIALRVNPALDLKAYAETYRKRGIVQIANVLDDRTANALADLLARGVPWRVLLTDQNDEPLHFSNTEVQALGQERFHALLADAFARARQNRGFFYHMYPMVEAYIQGQDPGHPIHFATEFLNSPEFLDIGRKVTGFKNISKAEAHATLYTRGHYLTRHVDYGAQDERRAAYVLSLTRGWQPDWGGLLLFLKDNQDVSEGYLPRFNVLTIFDVKYLHTVTQVSSFAGAGRYSLTGWFRNDAVKRG